MTPWLDDGDVAIHVGDVRAVLAELPDESVDCAITSPPYWGLRDYGTGSWAGGDPDCDHLGQPFRTKSKLNENWGAGFSDVKNAEGREPMGQTCSKCGARRVDQQLGLEPTPDLYVQNMVAVFRQVRRVLAPHGTCFLNLGDSYWGGKGQNGTSKALGNAAERGFVQSGGTLVSAMRPQDGKHDTLKPKDLVGIPWRVAFALQADGWWLRSDIIWAKPNPMPESVTDRPTKSHEQIFLLTKQPRYWFDQEAVREPHAPGSYDHHQRYAGRYGESMKNGGTKERGDKGATVGIDPTSSGRNIRSVWEIATQPFAEAHFATFPEELVRRCLLAGCPAEVCAVCGLPRERIVERDGGTYAQRKAEGVGGPYNSDPATVYKLRVGESSAETVGWSDCGHNAYRLGRVLDPFLGSGTTALVARHHGRHAVGVELNQAYAEIAAKRLQQLSLLGGVA